MTRGNVTQRLALAVKAGTVAQPQLAKRRISPHIVRHTTAMHLLQSGVGITVIALWLGHESPTTTHQYAEADLAMKERALARLQEPDTALRRFRARLADGVPEDVVVLCAEPKGSDSMPFEVGRAPAPHCS